MKTQVAEELKKVEELRHGERMRDLDALRADLTGATVRSPHICFACEAYTRKPEHIDSGRSFVVGIVPTRARGLSP